MILNLFLLVFSFWRSPGFLENRDSGLKLVLLIQGVLGPPHHDATDILVTFVRVVVVAVGRMEVVLIIVVGAATQHFLILPPFRQKTKSPNRNFLNLTVSACLAYPIQARMD